MLTPSEEWLTGDRSTRHAEEVQRVRDELRYHFCPPVVSPMLHSMVPLWDVYQCSGQMSREAWGRYVEARRLAGEIRESYDKELELASIAEKKVEEDAAMANVMDSNGKIARAQEVLQLAEEEVEKVRALLEKAEARAESAKEDLCRITKKVEEKIFTQKV